MDRNLRALLIAASLLFTTGASAATLDLTPVSNKGGQLPSGHEVITFTTRDANWIADIQLPVKPRAGDRVRIVANATYPSLLHAQSTNLNVPRLQLSQGQSIDLAYDAQRGLWLASGQMISNYQPTQIGDRIPDSHRRFSTYEMWNANWSRNIYLPAVAKEGDVIAINSLATPTARIAPNNVMFAGTLNIATGDRYSFIYREDFKKWFLRAAPVTEMLVQQGNALTLPTPSKPRTVITLSNGHWVPRVILPAQAGDRDRITVRSTAAYGSVVGNENTNSKAVTRLFAGAEYEYVYTLETRRWELVSSPTDTYQAKQIAGGNMGALRTPTTVVQFANANHVPVLRLPGGTGAGTRVVVDTRAASSFQVIAEGTRHVITNGELVSFIVDAAGRWQRETRTIDLLLLYSDKAAASLGEQAARARMFESFNLTNQALANSGANFRYRLAGLRRFTALPHWTAIGDALSDLRYNATAQAWRNQVKADGIYYEGTENGCGLAWVRASAVNMVATGSTGCGTIVMRHEMGHNMGLNHGGTVGGGYAQGYLPGHTVMAGNAVPYFATPLRLDPVDGIRLGLTNQFDGVRAMNENSPAIAAYR